MLHTHACDLSFPLMMSSRPASPFTFSLFLQALQISGVYAYAVGNTSWEGLNTLTSLTSLALQFRTEDKNAPRSFFSGCRGLLQFTGEWGVAPPIVRLEHLPASVQELRLANCYVGVPAEGCLRAG